MFHLSDFLYTVKNIICIWTWTLSRGLKDIWSKRKSKNWNEKQHCAEFPRQNEVLIFIQIKKKSLFITLKIKIGKWTFRILKYFTWDFPKGTNKKCAQQPLYKILSFWFLYKSEKIHLSLLVIIILKVYIKIW